MAEAPAPHPVQLRPALPDDVGAIFDIRLSVRENALSRAGLAVLGITPDSIGQMIRDGHSAGAPCAWVACITDQAVGFAMADLAEACLFAVFVRPGYEGGGVGRALVEQAEQALFAAHARIWLDTDPRSRAAGFYQRLGWLQTGPGATAGDIRMEKQRP